MNPKIKKGFKKFFIVFLSAVFILSPLKARAASPQIINKQVQTLASGEYQIHSSLVVNNMLFAGTRTAPAKILKWSNLSDLTSYSVNTFAFDNKHNNAESMTYDQTHNKIYIAFSFEYTSKIAVTQFDPDTFTFTDVIYDATENPGGSPAITNDGIYLYIITYNSPAKILKYQISDFTKVGSTIINDGVSNKNTGHAIIYDGVNLYATGASVPGWLAKINPSDLTHTVANFQSGDNTPTDDLASVGDYVYCGLEATTGIILRVKKSDLSLTRIATGQTTANYGVNYDGQYVWGVYNSAPGNLIRIDPNTLSIDTFIFNAGENYLNEILFDSQKIIATCWFTFGTPAKVLRFNIDTTSPVIAITRNPNQNLFNNNYQISVDFDDATTKEYELDSGGWTAYTDVVFVSAEGAHTFDARGTDVATNVGNATQTTFTIDKTPPVLSITSPTNNISTISSIITLSGISNDTGSGLASVTVNGTVVSNPASFSQNIALSFGLNTIAAIATDNAGNTTAQGLNITRNFHSSSALKTKKAIITNINKVNQKLQKIDQRRKIKLEALKNKVENRLAKIKNKLLQKIQKRK